MSTDIPARARYLADILENWEAAIELHRNRVPLAVAGSTSNAYPLGQTAGGRETLVAAMIQADAVNGLRKAIEFKSRG